MAKRLTEAELRRLQAAGTIRGFVDKGVIKKVDKTCKSPPKALQKMLKVLQTCAIAYEEEYRFCPDRRFRFDIAIVDRKIGIEYEGLMSKKSRHTTVTGYSKDAEKYNLAQSLGWKVLRYTTINYKQFEDDLKAIIDNEKSNN